MRHPAALEETHGFTPALINSARLGFNLEAVINNQVGGIKPAAADRGPLQPAARMLRKHAGQ